MIAPLRRRHRQLTLLLALASPALLVLGLMARPTWPAGTEQLEPASSIENPLRVIEARLAETPLRVAVAHDPARVELTFASDPVIAEGLVYLAHLGPEGELPPDGSLPADAQLLGALAGADARVFELTVEDLEGTGSYLLFFSLGKQEVAGHVNLGAATAEELGG